MTRRQLDFSERAARAHRRVRIALAMSYLGYAVATTASLFAPFQWWQSMLTGALLGVTIFAHIMIRRTWRRIDADLEAMRQNAPQPCEICGAPDALRLNSLWFCSAHLDEGVHRTVKLLAMQRDIPLDVQERTEQFVRDAIEQAGSGGDVGIEENGS